MSEDEDQRTKLLSARGEVLAILRKYDLCANVILVGRHHLEIILDLDASWSNLSYVRDGEGNEGIRLRSKPADYGGDKAAQRQDLEATVGLVHALAEIYAMNGTVWLTVSEQFDKMTGAEHTPMTKEHKQ